MSVGTASAGVGSLTELLTVTVGGGLDQLEDASDREFLIRLYDLAQKLVARNGAVDKDHASVVGMTDDHEEAVRGRDRPCGRIGATERRIVDASAASDADPAGIRDPQRRRVLLEQAEDGTAALASVGMFHGRGKGRGVFKGWCGKTEPT